MVTRSKPGQLSAADTDEEVFNRAKRQKVEINKSLPNFFIKNPFYPYRDIKLDKLERMKKALEFIKSNAFVVFIYVLFSMMCLFLKVWTDFLTK